MRIFQGINEIAGQMGIFAGDLTKRGHHVRCYNTFHSYLGYEENLLNLEKEELVQKVEDILTDYDIYHFHYAETLVDDFSDLAQLKKYRKKAVMHHWGNDVRFHEQARERNKYVYTGDSPANEVMHKKLTAISAIVKDAIVQDYEVYDYVKDYYERVHVLPIAVNLDHIPNVEETENKVPLLIHAPTNPLFKGTVHFEKVIEQLKESYEFNYVRIEQLNHEKALHMYQKADIILDQILCGSYGLFSVEAMAMGKPVVTYVRDDLLPTFPEIPPIVNANPDTLYDKIELLIKYPEVRKAYGKQGRRYVEAYHSSAVVTKQLEEIYKQLPTL
ncbi:glycosyltransferase family 4 protein [Alkalihalobacillus oceani]|uniref:glycosyltransferase family 4 protein n=1 Tax=Halalkalibacter oceani TaxID=1653776 RepID=UPI00203B4F04|nr:glycosyltransferase family 4 protein [Halalkalibacter oceani]MCM3761874.1 glycosyltransferase family 4 protein [Halalkalibacter oceani]